MIPPAFPFFKVKNNLDSKDLPDVKDAICRVVLPFWNRSFRKKYSMKEMTQQPSTNTPRLWSEKRFKPANRHAKRQVAVVTTESITVLFFHRFLFCCNCLSVHWHFDYCRCFLHMLLNCFSHWLCRLFYRVSKLAFSAFNSVSSLLIKQQKNLSKSKKRLILLSMVCVYCSVCMRVSWWKQRASCWDPCFTQQNQCMNDECLLCLWELFYPRHLWCTVNINLRQTDETKQHKPSFLFWISLQFWLKFADFLLAFQIQFLKCCLQKTIGSSRCPTTEETSADS